MFMLWSSGAFDDCRKGSDVATKQTLLQSFATNLSLSAISSLRLFFSLFVLDSDDSSGLSPLTSAVTELRHTAEDLPFTGCRLAPLRAEKVALLLRAKSPPASDSPISPGIKYKNIKT